MRACGSRCLSCSIFVRIKIVCHPVSHVISLLVSTSSSPQHEAPPGQHDPLQDDTVHREPLPKTTRSKSNAKEPLSHVNYESGGNLRTNTPTGPKCLRPKSLRQFLEVLWKKTSINETMYTENLVNKINKLQLLKK